KDLDAFAHGQQLRDVVVGQYQSHGRTRPRREVAVQFARDLLYIWSRCDRKACAWNSVVLEELSAITRGLGQLDTEGGLARLLASLVAASREFIGIADLEGNALFVNEAGRKLIGLRDLEAVHSTRIIDYFAADDHRKVMDEVLPAVRATGYWEGELNFR